MRRCKLAAAAIAFGLWTNPTDGRGADLATEAESLIQRGLRLREAGNDASAVPLFEEAHRLHPTPRSFAQLGFAEQAVGRSAEAERHVSEALLAVSDPWIKQHRTTIEGVLATIKKSIGTLEVVADPPGALILVNGKRQGHAPLARPIRVTRGTVHVEVSAAGHKSEARQVLVQSQAYESLVVRLQPIAGVGSEQPDDRKARQPGQDQEWKRPWRWAAWGAFAASGIALTFGTVEYLQYRSKVIEFNDQRDQAMQKRCFDDGNAIYGPNMSSPGADCTALASEYRSARSLAIAGFASGALLLGSAVVLTIVTSPQEPRVALRCGITWESRGVVCGGTF